MPNNIQQNLEENGEKEKVAIYRNLVEKNGRGGRKLGSWFVVRA